MTIRQLEGALMLIPCSAGVAAIVVGVLIAIGAAVPVILVITGVAMILFSLGVGVMTG
jgi:hypothetical protein